MLFTLFGDLVLFFNKLNLLPFILLKPEFVLGLKLDFEFWPYLRFKDLKGKCWNWHYNLTFLLMDKFYEVGHILYYPWNKTCSFSWIRVRNNPNIRSWTCVTSRKNFTNVLFRGKMIIWIHEQSQSLWSLRSTKRLCSMLRLSSRVQSTSEFTQLLRLCELIVE